MSFGENYQRIEERIAVACARAGRRREELHLIAVSKTHPVAAIESVAALGQRDFGENRIAELIEKKHAVRAAPLQWHLIGQLQTNKVKLLESDIIVHSLDRESLADKLEQRFTGEKIHCLIQVNCSREPNKSGVAVEHFAAFTEYVAAKKAIAVLGLMTMAEDTADERHIRATFAELRELSERLHASAIFSDYAGWLSMGMSNDFEYAIAEGATHIRIGNAIFGARTA